jgi:hypothetical protein
VDRPISEIGIWNAAQRRLSSCVSMISNQGAGLLPPGGVRLYFGVAPKREAQQRNIAGGNISGEATTSLGNISGEVIRHG